MKYILALILVTSLIGCAGMDKKYRIENGKNIHYTDNYNKTSEGCIIFQEQCGCAGDNNIRTVTVCGSYEITTLK